MVGSTASSAFHSARNSLRRPGGTSRESAPIHARRSLRIARRRQASQVREALQGDGKGGGAGPGDLVVAPRRTLFAPRDLLVLPAGADEAERLEAAQRRIDGAGLQAGAIGDVEAVA